MVERMNRTIQQMAQAMLDEFGTPATFLCEATFVALAILKKVYVWVKNNQTPYELSYGKPPTIKQKSFWNKMFHQKDG